MKVSEIMHDAVTVKKDLTLKEAAKLMAKKGISSLIFIKNNKLAGIITERDIMKNVTSLNKNISRVAKNGVITIPCDESVDNAIILMSHNKIKRLPVTKGKKLVGIITTTDIFANAECLNESFMFY